MILLIRLTPLLGRMNQIESFPNCAPALPLFQELPGGRAFVFVRAARNEFRNRHLAVSTVYQVGRLSNLVYDKFFFYSTKLS
jgi:hypothetical protein